MFSGLLIKKHWLQGVDSPEDIDPSKYLGKKFKVRDDDGREMSVIAEEILGSIKYPWKFQINSKGKSYFISALDLFGQGSGYQFTKDDINEFESDFKTAVVMENKNYRLFQRKI